MTRRADDPKTPERDIPAWEYGEGKPPLGVRLLGLAAAALLLASMTLAVWIGVGLPLP